MLRAGGSLRKKATSIVLYDTTLHYTVVRVHLRHRQCCLEDHFPDPGFERQLRLRVSSFATLAIVAEGRKLGCLPTNKDHCKVTRGDTIRVPICRAPCGSRTKYS